MVNNRCHSPSAGGAAGGGGGNDYGPRSNSNGGGGHTGATCKYKGERSEDGTLKQNGCH